MMEFNALWCREGVVAERPPDVVAIFRWYARGIACRRLPAVAMSNISICVDICECGCLVVWNSMFWDGSGDRFNAVEGCSALRQRHN